MDVAKNSTVIEVPGPDNQNILFVAYCVIGPIIIVVGVIGNSLTLITLNNTVRCNSMTYVYIKWLAVTDICALLSAIPMDIRLGTPHRKLPYWIAVFQAHVEIPMLNFFMGSSIFIVIFLTRDRFISMCYPMTYWTMRHNRTPKIWAMLCFAFAFVLNAPLTVLKEVCTSEDDLFEPKENTEITHTTPWKVYIYASEGIMRIAPIIMLTTMNILIIRRFYNWKANRNNIFSQKTRETETKSAHRLGGLNHAEERLMLGLLSIIVFLFVILNFPSAILSVLYAESRESSRAFQIFRACANNFELANLAVNFFAYCVVVPDFRKAFLEVILGYSATEERLTERLRRRAEHDEDPASQNSVPRRIITREASLPQIVESSLDENPSSCTVEVHREDA